MVVLSHLHRTFFIFLDGKSVCFDCKRCQYCTKESGKHLGLGLASEFKWSLNTCQAARLVIDRVIEWQWATGGLLATEHWETLGILGGRICKPNSMTTLQFYSYDDWNNYFLLPVFWCWLTINWDLFNTSINQALFKAFHWNFLIITPWLANKTY